MNVTGIHFLFSLLIFLFSKGGGISYVATHHSDEYRAFRGGSHWFFRFLISLWFNSKKVWDICHNTKNIWTLMAPTLWGTITTSSTTKEYDSKKFSLLTLNNAKGFIQHSRSPSNQYLNFHYGYGGFKKYFLDRLLYQVVYRRNVRNWWFPGLFSYIRNFLNDFPAKI